MDTQYSIIPLGISTRELLSSSMQLLQQPLPTSIDSTTDMDSIHMLPHSHDQLHHPEQQQQSALPSASLLTSEESDQEGSASAQQQRQLEEEAGAAGAVTAEQGQEQRIQRRQGAELVEQEQVELAAASYHQQLEEQHHQQAQSHNDNRVIPTTSPPNMRAPSPLIISHQQYQEQPQQQPQQVMEDNIFSHTPLPAPQQVLMQQQPPVSIMDPQYSIIPLGISTSQLLGNSMQLLQQPLPTTTSIATNMDNIYMLPHSHDQLHHPEQQQQAALPPASLLTLEESDQEGSVSALQQCKLKEQAESAATVAAGQEQEQQLVEQEQEQTEVPVASYHQQLEEQHQQQAQSHNPSPPIPLIIAHQQYQEQPQQQPQQVIEDDIFSNTPLPAPQQVLTQQQPPVSIMDPQYSIIPLGISTPQLFSNSMQLLQQPLPTTTNMDSIHMLPYSHHQLHHPEQQHQAALSSMPNTLLSNTNIQSHLGTIGTTITPQLLQPLPQQQLTSNTIPMTYHTIIGNGVNGHSNNGSSGELLQIATLDSYGNLQPQQMFTTANGQILQLLPSGTTFMGQPLFSLPATRSPQEGDLPPSDFIMPGHGHDMTNHQAQTQAIVNLPSYLANVTSSTLMEEYAKLIAETNNLKAQLHMARNMATMSNAAPDTDPSSTVSTSGSLRKPYRARTIGNGGVKRKREPDSNNQYYKSNGANIGLTTTMPRTETLPTGRIKCLECNKEFTKMCYLVQHNRSHHSGERPYRCEICGKRFQDENIYTTHLGRHKTQDKPYKCEHCPKQFHYKSDLQRHVDGIHTGFNQHMCDTCQRSFCRQDYLRKHMAIHSRPKFRWYKSRTSDASSETKMSTRVSSGDTDTKDEKQEATSIFFETDDDYYARQIDNIHDDNVIEYETVDAETGVNECDIDGGDSAEFLTVM